ncbi:MAG: TerB family tellurite resistance protein [Azoarcus sp.]|jgi:hypothetical protein|nr:TerB family tellurite resistance protein [Azoarcus sp.]
MFLSYLDTKEQKKFFMDFAFLIALADNREAQKDKSSNKKDVALSSDFFTETNNAFPICQGELSKLQAFANEIEQRDWLPEYHSYNTRLSSLSETEELVLQRLLSEIPKDERVLPIMPVDNPRDKVIKTRLGDGGSILERLKKAFDLSQHRSVALWIAFFSILPENNKSYPEEIKRAMLLGATEIAYADGSYSPDENMLLQLFCRYFNVDAGLIDEFKERSKKIHDIHAECLEIVTE